MEAMKSWLPAMLFRMGDRRLGLLGMNLLVGWGVGMKKRPGVTPGALAGGGRACTDGLAQLPRRRISKGVTRPTMATRQDTLVMVSTTQSHKKALIGAVGIATSQGNGHPQSGWR